MRIEFLNPSNELIGLLAGLEEFLIGEIVVTDAIHVEAVTPRAINLVNLLKDPIFTRPTTTAGTTVHIISDKDNIDPTVDHDEQFRIAIKSAFDAAGTSDDR